VVVPAAGEEARSRCETCVHFFREVAARVHVHLESMTLIYCGKKLTADRLHTVQDKALILVLGRAKEDETGCDLRDVDCMMAQLGLGRDECVRLLKRHDFDLLDAMLHS
jgi:imidazoleglycerol phosphate dehydratase HisB